MARSGFYTSTCVQCGTSFRHQHRTQDVCSHACSRQRQLGPVADRFWSKVEKTDDGCWLWTGQHNVKGYGVFKLDATYIPAHRLSYTLHIGPIPDNREIAHRCDVRDCVRPDHLWPATHAENIADMVAKGRRAPTIGTANPNYRHGRYVIASSRHP